MGVLVAGGDSFVYGSELADCLNRPSTSTYPALIAKKLNLEYVCAAQPGFANNSIRRTVMDACEQNDVERVIVQWTFPDRYEFHFNYDIDDSAWYQVNAWSTLDTVKEIEDSFKKYNPVIMKHHSDHLNKIKSIGLGDFAKTFYQHVGTDLYWEQYNMLSEIIMLQQYLDLRNIPYLFTCHDRLMFRKSHHFADDSLRTLIKLLKEDKWMWFPNSRGFYIWAMEENYPIGTTHPLEEAHLQASELVYEHIRNIGWLS